MNVVGNDLYFFESILIIKELNEIRVEQEFINEKHLDRRQRIYQRIFPFVIVVNNDS